MGRHEIGEDGISYSMRKAMDKGEMDLRSKLIRIHRKCAHFILHDGKHVVGLIGLHTVAILFIEKGPVHYLILFMTNG